MGEAQIWEKGGGDPKMRGIPKEGSRDGIPKYGESQNMGEGMDGGPKIWEKGWGGTPKYGESQKKGAGMGSQNKRNPKMWEQGWWGSQNKRNPKLWGI